MKFLKYIIAIVFILISVFLAKADVKSGNGCRIGDVVWTDYLGSTSFYGTDYSTYNRNGQLYNIDYNPGTQCDYIEVSKIQSQNKQCWVNSAVNPKNDQTGASYGTLVSYTVNTCKAPTGLPLDDFVWVIILVAGGLGAFVISKKILA